MWVSPSCIRMILITLRLFSQDLQMLLQFLVISCKLEVNYCNLLLAGLSHYTPFIVEVFILPLQSTGAETVLVMQLFL